jgi:hypothetical protein
MPAVKWAYSTYVTYTSLQGQAEVLVYATFSYKCMRLSATSACGLMLLVHITYTCLKGKAYRARHQRPVFFFVTHA